MKTHKFARKPFYVDAVRVTDRNMEEVAQWCGGKIETDKGGKNYISVQVQRPLNDRQTTAYVGDWVLQSGTNFKVFMAKAFDRSFEKVKTLSKPQADAAGIHPPHETSQKPDWDRKPVPKPPKHRPRPANPVISEQDAAKLNAPDEVVAKTPKDAPQKDDAERLVEELMNETRHQS